MPLDHLVEYQPVLTVRVEFVQTNPALDLETLRFAPPYDHATQLQPAHNLETTKAQP